jgi:hypothetical protein
MLPARTYSITINRNRQALYEAIWRPETFSQWASGLIEADLRQSDGGWIADGVDGPIIVHFTPYNAFGVMDHVVETGNGQSIHVPLRVVQNGDGAEVMLTLFRQPGMTDETFERRQMDRS